MKVSQTTEKNTIVINGSWNRRIFTPEWITNGRLTNEKEIVIEAAIHNPELPTRFVFENSVLSVSETKLIVWSKDCDEGTDQKLEQLIKIICEELAHTPVSAFGINFAYQVKDPTPEILNFFNGDDKNLLSDEGYEIENSVVKRSIKINDSILHLTSQSNEGDGVEFHFNFHQDVRKTEEISKCILGKVAEYKKISEKILEKLNVTQDDD